MSHPCAIGGLDPDSEHPRPHRGHGWAERGPLCDRCQWRFGVDLAWLQTAATLLSDHLAPAATGDAAHGVPASRPPLRIDVLSWSAKGGIDGILGSWVQLLVEHDRCTPPGHRLARQAYIQACLKRIAAQATWLMERDFAGEVYLEVAELRHDIAYILGETERRWRPLPGKPKCPIETDDGVCGGRLSQYLDEPYVRCAKCETTWEGIGEMERLGLVIGVDPTVNVDMAARQAGVHRTTIWRWVETGSLSRRADGRIDKQELAIVIAQRQRLADHSGA